MQDIDTLLEAELSGEDQHLFFHIFLAGRVIGGQLCLGLLPVVVHIVELFGGHGPSVLGQLVPRHFKGIFAQLR